MKSRIALITWLVVILAVQALAGFDMYNGKHYTELVAPTPIGVYYTGGGADHPVTNTTAAVSNTPVSLVSYPGNGTLLLSVNPGSGSIVATMKVATNVGNAVSWTNSSPATSTAQLNWSTNQWTFTGATNQTALFRPSAELGRVQVRFDATGVTNGTVAAMVITE